MRHLECVTLSASPWARLSECVTLLAASSAHCRLSLRFLSPASAAVSEASSAGCLTALSPPLLGVSPQRVASAPCLCVPLTEDMSLLPGVCFPTLFPSQSLRSYGLARDGKDALEVGRREVSRAAIVTWLLGSESHLCDAPPFESNWFVALSLEDLRLAQGSMHVYSAVGGILGFSNVSESPVYTWRQIFKRTTSYTSFTNPIRLKWKTRVWSMNISKYPLECSSIQIICNFLLQYVWWRNVAWLFLGCDILFANGLLVSSLQTVNLIFQAALL